MIQQIKLLLLLAVILAFFPFTYHLYVQVALAVVVLLMIIRGMSRGTIRMPAILNHYTIIMTLWFAWSLLSILWVPDKSGWLYANGIHFTAWIHSLSLALLLKEKSFQRHLFKLLMGIIVVHNLIGWFEWLTLQQYFEATRLNYNLDYTMGNPMLFFSNINDYALLMLFGVVLTLVWPPFQAEQLRRKPWFYSLKIILLLSNLCLIYLVHSRGILFAALYSIVFIWIIGISHQVIRRMLLIGIILLSAVTILMFYTNIVELLVQDGSFVVRYNLIRNGWHHLKMSDYIGVGAGNLEYYMANFRYYPTADYNVMHNWWMGTLTAYGAGFFVIYGLYHAYAFIVSYLGGVNRQSNGKLVATWLLGFIIAGMIPNTLFMFVWFWLIHNIIFSVFEASREEMIDELVKSEDSISALVGKKLRKLSS